MVEGKGNRSNCKTWILAWRESLCARPVAMDGSDFGKFNTPLAHKQKTRKINLGRMGGSREPNRGFLLGWKRAWLSLHEGPGLHGRARDSGLGSWRRQQQPLCHGHG